MKKTRSSFLQLILFSGILLTGFICESCTRDDSAFRFRENVSFEISSRLLEGKRIDCITFGNKGKVWVASGNQLFLINDGVQSSWTLDRTINDLAEGPDETLWIGSHDGLGRFEGSEFTWFTTANAGLPSKSVSNVKISKDGNVWFSCSAFRIGGIGIYDGKTFEFLTPDNSPLNQNIIDDLEIGEDGTVYVATAGTVGRTNIYRIKDRVWECLGDEKGTFYWTFSFAVSQQNEIYLVEDFSLSSSTLNKNKLYLYSGDKWKQLPVDFDISFFSRMTTDQRNYFWLTNNASEYPKLYVYDGKSWISSADAKFDGGGFTVIKSDSDNNIWLGTFNNGIIILKQ